MLIITSAAFEGQADELAEWKREKGFLTKVVTLDDIDSIEGGTTGEDIRAYINDVYDTYNLSYVLLIGDAEFIPPHYVTPHPTGHGNTLMGTDLYYAEMDYAGYFPDLAVGRIPVDTVAEAQIVVDKIINYEQNPPIDQDFYRTILCAAFFQDDDRDGIAEASDSDGRAQREFAETIRISALFFCLKDILPVPGYMPRIVLIRSTGETAPLFRQRFVCLGFHGMGMPMILLLQSIQGHFWSRTETTAEGQDGVIRTFI